MSEKGTEQQRKDTQKQNDVIRDALQAKVDPKEIARLAAIGDRTIIIEDNAGGLREIIFVAPDFPAPPGNDQPTLF
jgi:hypothetical protein